MSQLFTHTDGHTWDDCSVCHCHVKAMPADLVAAIRDGVAEETIEVQWCKTHEHSAPPCGARMNCNIVPVLMVPLNKTMRNEA